MNKPGLFYGLVLLAGACSAQAPPPAEAPQFPEALRGCWEMNEAPSEEHPDGLSSLLTVGADRVILDGAGVFRRVGRIEQVRRITPDLIEGRVSADENGRLSTMATTLSVAREDAPPGALLLREGDAGSYQFRRCSAETQAAQRYSLVIAESGRQTDPKPAPCGPDGSCDDFLYRSEFRKARVIVGGDLPAAFEARLKLHTPYISDYVLALIVERQKDGSLVVRRQAGFNGRTGVACFNAPDEWPVGWTPIRTASVRYERETLCVSDPSQIDPDAPKV